MSAPVFDDSAQLLPAASTSIPSLLSTPAQLTSIDNINEDEGDNGITTFQWNIQSVISSIALFLVAGLCEIGGGWMVWKAVREGKPLWWAVAGSLILIGYGFVPTLQPTDTFGRIYAVYGGFFIALSFLWGWWIDNDRPDIGDVVGCGISLLGVMLILFWPR